MRSIELWGALAPLRISRFPDAQCASGVWSFGPSRNDSSEQQTKKRPGKPGRFCMSGPEQGVRKPSILLEEARKLLLEARHTAAAVEELLRAAGPGRVRPGVDIEVQLVAFLAPGGAGLVLGPVGHHDRNHMIIRMNFGFHGRSFGAPAPVANVGGYGISRLYNVSRPPKQATYKP